MSKTQTNRCPVCNGFGSVGNGSNRNTCHGCKGAGYIIIPQYTIACCPLCKLGGGQQDLKQCPACKNKGIIFVSNYSAKSD